MQLEIRQKRKYINKAKGVLASLSYNKILYIDLSDNTNRYWLFENRFLLAEWLCLSIVNGRLYMEASPNTTGENRVAVLFGAKKMEDGSIYFCDDKSEVVSINQPYLGNKKLAPVIRFWDRVKSMARRLR